MQRQCIYRLKENNQLNKIDSMFAKYVIVEDFARKALGEDRELYCIYRGIDINTFEYTNQILGYSMLTPTQFEENFELFMDQKAIKLKIEELVK